MTEIGKVATRRRRNAKGTKAAILDAARAAFMDKGYAGAGVREIAASAGVTASMINRYFGSKERLFDEVMFDSQFSLTSLLDDPDNLGSRLAKSMLEYRHPADFNPTLVFLKSLGDPAATNIIRTHIETWAQPLASLVQPPHRTLRAELVLAILSSTQIYRNILQTHGHVDATPEELIEILAPLLQSVIGPASVPSPAPGA